MRRGVLSIKTTKPKQGRTARYDDVVGSDGYFRYAFQGNDPGNHDNTCLREAFEDRSPLIYLYALVPGVYQILYPSYVIEWNPSALSCTIAVGSPQEIVGTVDMSVPNPVDRRYSTIEAKVRLHQAEFRELVLSAYGRRCAVSGLPIPDLLQAAHIIPDRDERGRPEVRNGICLSTLHHAAYDRNLLGIDPDGCIHIAPSVLDQHDGPTLEMAIKEHHKRKIHLPRHTEDRPNRDFLAERYDQFRHAA